MNNRYKEVTINDGVKLFIHSDKTMKKTCFSITIKYGSSGEYYDFNYDGKDYHVLPGCAHFLEHMLFEHSPYGDLYSLFRTLKYESNAYTSLNITKYYFMGKGSIKSSVRKAINAIEKPVFNEENIKITSRAIVEETKLPLNDPYREVDALSARNTFESFDYYSESLSSIGTEETTKKLDYNMLKLCYDAFYYDSNKVITIAGPFDEEDMINYIKGIYKNIKPHKNKTKVFIPNNLNIIRKDYDILVRPTVGNDDVLIRYNNTIKGYSKYEIDMFLTFICYVSFSNKSLFYERLKKAGIIHGYDGKDIINVYDSDVYALGIGYTVKDRDKFLEEFQKEITNLKFDENDFELFKKSELASLILDEESKYYFYQRLSNIYFYYNGIINEEDEIRKLSFDRLVKFYKSLDFSNKSITILTKEGKDGK